MIDYIKRNLLHPLSLFGVFFIILGFQAGILGNSITEMKVYHRTYGCRL